MRKCYTQALIRNENPFDVFERYIDSEHNFSRIESSGSNMTELKLKKNMKLKGDIFERFCQVYLRHTQKYDDVWLLHEVPEHILITLNLSRRDMGIDLVCRKDGVFYAVQSKYRRCTGQTRILSWNTLSTFYALCLRSGPWASYVVMTNCDYVRRAGKKTTQDVSICLRTFRSLSHEDWITMGNVTGNKMIDIESNTQSRPVQTVDALRNARLAYLNRSTHS